MKCEFCGGLAVCVRLNRALCAHCTSVLDHEMNRSYQEQEE